MRNDTFDGSDSDWFDWTLNGSFDFDSGRRTHGALLFVRVKYEFLSIPIVFVRDDVFALLRVVFLVPLKAILLPQA